MDAVNSNSLVFTDSRWCLFLSVHTVFYPESLLFHQRRVLHSCCMWQLNVNPTIWSAIQEVFGSFYENIILLVTLCRRGQLLCDHKRWLDRQLSCLSFSTNCSHSRSSFTRSFSEESLETEWWIFLFTHSSMKKDTQFQLLYSNSYSKFEEGKS